MCHLVLGTGFVRRGMIDCRVSNAARVEILLPEPVRPKQSRLTNHKVIMTTPWSKLSMVDDVP
jgi:hypothetical protein